LSYSRSWLGLLNVNFGKMSIKDLERIL
jgi:hypothetical protein